MKGCESLCFDLKFVLWLLLHVAYDTKLLVVKAISTRKATILQGMLSIFMDFI